MPYGIHSASETCQATVSEIIIGGLQGAANSHDDIIVWGRSKEELKQRTVAVLKTVRKGGLKLRKSKCQLKEFQYERTCIFRTQSFTSRGRT